MAKQKQNVEIFFKINGLEAYIDDLETLNETLDKVAAATKQASDEQSKLSNSGGKFGKVLKSVGSVGSKAFKGIGLALKATGLGIFLDLGARLVEWFNNTDAGAKIIQGSLAVVGVVFERIQGYISNIIDFFQPLFEDPLQAIKDFGAALVENITNRLVGIVEFIPSISKAVGELFKGNFKEAGTIALDAVAKIGTGVDNFTEKATDAFEAVKEEVTEIVKESVKAVEASNDLVDSQNRLQEETAKLTVENAELNQELETQKKIAEDTTRSYDERKAALDRVNAANEKLADNAVKQAQLELDALERAKELATTDQERRDLTTQIAEATATLIDTQTAQQITRLESAQLSRELDQEELDRLEELRAKQKEVNDKAREEELKAIEEQNKAIADAQQALEDAKFNIAQGGIALASALAGENEKLQNAIFLVDKAVAAGKVVVDAVKAKAANLAYAATLGPAGPAYLIPANQAVNLNAAAGLATIAATTIAKFKGGGGFAQPGGGEVGLPKTPGASILPGQTPPEETGTAEPPVLKTYVISTDVTTAQQGDAQIDNLARL